MSPDEGEDESEDDIEVEGVLVSEDEDVVELSDVDPEVSPAEVVLHVVVAVTVVPVVSQEFELDSGDSVSFSPTFTGDVLILVFSFEATEVVVPEFEIPCTVVVGIGLLELTDATFTDPPFGLVAMKYPHAASVATIQVASALTIKPCGLAAEKIFEL